MSAQKVRIAWIQGGAAECEIKPPLPPRVFRLVLLGAPGVGKGTQAELLCERLGTCHLSTGDIFRAAKCLAAEQRSPALDSALGYMKRGDLVPDQTVLDLVRERTRCVRCHGGFLLDGFPRTVAQAEAFDQILQKEDIALDGVLNYELPIEKVVARLGGRRTCPGCKAVFHVTGRPPRVEGVCDHCGGKLQQREDDRPEAVRVRMEVYEKSTKPLTDFYRKRGLLVNIEAEGTAEEVYQRTLDALNSSHSA
ncbi:MAG TPA: nucleoside monophosphate kinase [Candidatus Acidoferrum sp.]|nr:nucleoside monophosphate kinase [Candidatus Acidoferrum sp.]